jgi:hypothetical protein
MSNINQSKRDFVEQSKKYYLGQDGYKKMNCTQAILYGFKGEINKDNLNIESFSNYRHGKAPQGECGAFYTTKTILENNNHKDKLKEFEQYFLNKAGSLKCKEIRASKSLTCLGCIEKSSEFLNTCLNKK